MESDRYMPLALSYTEAWCSQHPERVAEHFAETGWLRINGGLKAIGRAAITEVARSFMTAFPDLQVLLDKVVTSNGRTEYHWTLAGTHNGPGGSGNRVRISGKETWLIDSAGCIAESEGQFDAGEYQRQLEA